VTASTGQRLISRFSHSQPEPVGLRQPLIVAQTAGKLNT
jgi:hypothetical protein